MATMSLSFHKSVNIRKKSRIRDSHGSITTYGIPNDSVGADLRLGNTFVLFNLFAIQLIRIY